MTQLRLPRGVEEDPNAAELVAELEAHALPWWPGSSERVPQAELAPPLETAITRAYSASRIVRGLESAEHGLAAEERGLTKVDRRTGVARGGRVSRLLLLAEDGSERFYRSVESLERRYAPRVLCVRLSVDEHTLGSLLYGTDARARLLMVSHKEAVCAVLMALAEQWSTPLRPGTSA